MKKCYVLFFGHSGCGIKDEEIIAIFDSKELAKEASNKIQLFGGVAGWDFTRIKKYNIKLK